MNGRWMMLMCAAWPAAAIAQLGTNDPTRPDAVVTARSDSAAAALRACLARHCPPDEDIKASLNQASAQFVNGDYQDARATLSAARKRNGRFAKQYPLPVSRLHSAIALVASHLGEGEAAWAGRLDALSALKAGLPADDPRILLGRLDMADGYVFANRFGSALDEYEGIAGRARKLDLPNIEGAALLRRAQLLVRLSAKDAVAYKGWAKAALTDLAKLTGPELAPYATAARTLQTQLAITGKPADVERAVAAYRPAGPAHTPQLLYAPAIDINPASAAADGSGLRTNQTGNQQLSANTLARLPIDNFEKQWIDVAFEIRADGRVADIHIARQSSSLDGPWAKRVTDAIAGRRYAPMRIEGGGGVPRLERYTFTSLMETPTGTRLRTRSAKPALQVLDLSDTLPG